MHLYRLHARSCNLFSYFLSAYLSFYIKRINQILYVYISDQPIKTMIQIQMSDQTPIRSSLSKQLIFCHYVALLLANDFFWWKMIKIS